MQRSGGCLVVTIAAGQSSYASSVANEIRSFSWARPYTRSFTVAYATLSSVTRVIQRGEVSLNRRGKGGRNDEDEDIEEFMTIALMAVSVGVLILCCVLVYFVK